MNTIKEVLDKQGRTQKWLAQQIGKSYNMTNLYVTNKKQPSLETLYKIANAINVGVKELIIDNSELD